MIDRETLKRRIEFLECYPPPTPPTKESVAEYASLHGISKGEAWPILRMQHAKEVVAARVLLNSLKRQLLFYDLDRTRPRFP